MYVADAGNNRVQWFTPQGAVVGEFNGSGSLPNEIGVSAPEPLSRPETIAVDNSCAYHKPLLLRGTRL